MITDPRASESRRAKEATIRVIDLIAYFIAAAGGVFALTVTPDSIRQQLAGWEWLGLAWGIVLLLAGGLAFAGRLSKYWLPEVVGVIFAITGAAIYLIILTASSFHSTTAWVAICLISIAMLAMVRRYVELQIFTTDPEVKTLADRIAAILHRRTPNIADTHR